jgi:hypothetical protein
MALEVLTSVRDLRCGRSSEVSISVVECGCDFRFVVVLDTDRRPGYESEMFAWVWDASSDESRNETLRTISWMAGAQAIAWCDADHVCDFIQDVGRTIDREKYAPYRTKF